MKIIKPLLFTSAAIIGFWAGVAHAETSFSLGAGGAVSPEYMGSDEYQFSAFPYVDLSWESDEEMEGNGIAVGLHSASLNVMDGATAELVRINFGNHQISNSISLGYNGGRDADDDSALNGLGDIDGYLTGTAVLSYSPIEPKSGFFVTGSLELEGDLSGETDGITLTAGVQGNHLVSEKLMLSHGPHLTWANDDHTQAYFGISQKQANRSQYNQYNADGGLRDAGYGINAQYELTDHIGLFAGADYSHILGDAKDSPLVDQEGSDNQFTSYFGAAYSF